MRRKTGTLPGFHYKIKIKICGWLLCIKRREFIMFCLPVLAECTWEFPSVSLLREGFCKGLPKECIILLPVFLQWLILILMLHPQWPRANLENAKVCAYTDWTIENGWSWLCDHIAKISGENKALLSLCVQSCTMLFVSSNTLPHISPVWYISDDKQEGEMAVIGWELERHKHRYEHTTAMLNASRKVNSTGAVKKMSANLLL